MCIKDLRILKITIYNMHKLIAFQYKIVNTVRRRVVCFINIVLSLLKLALNCIQLKVKTLSFHFQAEIKRSINVLRIFRIYTYHTNMLSFKQNGDLSSRGSVFFLIYVYQTLIVSKQFMTK